MANLCLMEPWRCHSPSYTQSCTRFLQRRPLQLPVLAALAAVPLTPSLCLPFSLGLPAPLNYFLGTSRHRPYTIWALHLQWSFSAQVSLHTCPSASLVCTPEGCFRLPYDCASALAWATRELLYPVACNHTFSSKFWTPHSKLFNFWSTLAQP